MFIFLESLTEAPFFFGFSYGFPCNQVVFSSQTPSLPQRFLPGFIKLVSSNYGKEVYIDIAYVGMLLKDESKRVVLLPMDIELPCQPSNHLSNFSSRRSQSAICSLDLDTGTPRYFIGHFPTAQLKVSACSKDVSTSWLIIIASLLAKLILIPNMESYKCNRN